MGDAQLSAMVRGLLLALAAAVLIASPATAAESERTFGVGGASPGATGDFDGFETNIGGAQQVIADADENAALDDASGTACGTVFTPACGCGSLVRDSHRFAKFGHSVNIPASGAYILGIGVRMRAKSNSAISDPKLYVRVSLDGGSTWSACSAGLTLNTTYRTLGVDGIAFGGPTNLLGFDSTMTNAQILAAVRSDSFMIETWTAASSGARDFLLTAISTSVWFAVDTPTPTVTPTGPTQTPPNTATRTWTPTPTPLGNVLTVNTNKDCDDIDPGDGFCSADAGNPCGKCCLAAAIQESNASVGTQRITFQYSGDYYLDRDDSEVGEITDNAIIEGPGARDDLRIHLSSRMKRFASQTNVTVSISHLSIWTGIQRRCGPSTTSCAAQFGGCYAMPNGGDLSLTDVHFDGCDNQVNDADSDAGNGSMGGSIFADNGAIIHLDNVWFEQGGSTWGGHIAAIGDSKVYANHTYFHGAVGRGTKVIGLSCGDTVGGGGCVFMAGTGFSELIVDSSTFYYCIGYKGLGGGAFLNGDNNGQDLTDFGGGPDRGVPDVGTGGLVRFTNVTINCGRARASRGGMGESFGGTVEFYHVTAVGSPMQSRCDSAFVLHDAAHFKSRNSVMGAYGISVPSAGFQMCKDDGTATYDLQYTLNDANPPGGETYNGNVPTPCPSAIPVGDDCVSSTLGENGGSTQTLMPLHSGCVSTQTGDVHVDSSPGDRAISLEDGASPVIDVAPCIPGIDVDQRGVARPQAFNESPARPGIGLCDIGAVEVRPTPGGG